MDVHHETMSAPPTVAKGVIKGGGVTKSQSRKLPDGFRDGDEGYGSFVNLSKSTAALDEYDRKRTALAVEARDARRERVVQARELQAYRELALRAATRKSFSDWLAGGISRTSELESEQPQAIESDSKVCTRTMTHESIQPMPSRSDAEVEDGFDAQTTSSSREFQRKEEGSNRFDGSLRGGTGRAERSWARKALQSALVESKAKQVEWFH